MNKNLEPLLLIGVVALVKAKRNKNIGPALLRVRNEFNNLLQTNSYLDSAPFKTINLILRLGDVENLEPDSYKINKKHDELHIGVMLDTFYVQKLVQTEIESYFRKVLIEIHCDIAANYDLPYEFLEHHRGHI